MEIAEGRGQRFKKAGSFRSNLGSSASTGFSEIPCGLGAPACTEAGPRWIRALLAEVFYVESKVHFCTGNPSVENFQTASILVPYSLHVF